MFIFLCAFRFFIESISYLRDTATVELFYLQAKQSIFKVSIPSNNIELRKAKQGLSSLVDLR